jgi:hypothetical protein
MIKPNLLASYCFRTFATESEARATKAALEAAFPWWMTAPIRVAYSDYVYRWALYCHPGDARALYVKSREISI